MGPAIQFIGCIGFPHLNNEVLTVGRLVRRAMHLAIPTDQQVQPVSCSVEMPQSDHLAPAVI